MKKVLIAIICALLLGAPSIAASHGEQYWYCYQVGTIEKENLFVYSPIWADELPNHYSLREKLFADKLKKEKKKFHAQFEAQCVDYDSIERAQKHLNKKLKLSKKVEVRTIALPYQFSKALEKLKSKPQQKELY